jgi:ubiquitin-protein ligase E3 C
MMNFNGQLKKRSVNLGGGFRQTRTTLLQQTQKEREKRERERSKEKGLLVLRGAVVRYLELLRFKADLAEKWDESVVNYYDINQLAYWLTLFYAATYTRNNNAFLQLESLVRVLTEDNINELTGVNRQRLLRMVRDTITKVNINNENDIRVTELLLHIATVIPSKGEVPLISTLTTLASKLVEASNLSVTSQVTDVINRYSSMETQNYLLFLSSPWITEIPNLEINFKYLSNELPHTTITLEFHLKLQFLINCVEKTRTYTSHFFKALAWIVSSFDVSLITGSEAIDSSDEEQETRYKQRIINDETDTSIKKLYTRHFITSATELVEDPQILTRLFGSLIVLKPTLKSTFVIYLIPSGFQPLLNQVLSNDIFNKFSNMDESSVFSISPNFIRDTFVNEVEFLHYDLFVFLELLQYRLIISNDHEMFLKYDFTREKFIAFALFLKKFVFNVIWNHQIIQQYSGSKKTEMLSDLSIKVLAQVYLKDSRLQILDKGAWLIDPNKLNLGNIINVITEYEEKKNDVSNYSEGEGEIFLQTLNGDLQSKLQIYQKAPFFISFEKRAEIFQGLVDVDRAKLGLGDSNMSFFSTFLERKHTAVIRREHLLEDAFDNFNRLGEQFKTKLAIEFHNQYGKEEGIDGGGITKEFLTSVVSNGFQEPLFVENAHHELYPNPEIGLKYQQRMDSSKQLERLNYMNFMGKVLGKCLYERVLVDVTFATFFLTKFNTGYKNSFDDLKSLDSELYSNLVKLLKLSDEELDSLNLTFSIDERVDKKNIAIDLIPGGSLTPVTSSNRLKFIHEVSNYKLNKMVMLQCNSFLNGLYEIISKDWLAMFNPYELQLLISGESDINVEDLKAHCVYGGFSTDDKTVVDLWEVVKEMTSSERFQFVKFVTSVPRAPLLGFKSLVPLFGIRNTGSDVDRLPTSSTCVNLLKLPNYRDKQLLKQKLLYAIKAEAGFDLS